MIGLSYISFFIIALQKITNCAYTLSNYICEVFRASEELCIHHFLPKNHIVMWEDRNTSPKSCFYCRRIHQTTSFAIWWPFSPISVAFRSAFVDPYLPVFIGQYHHPYINTPNYKGDTIYPLLLCLIWKVTEMDLDTIILCSAHVVTSWMVRSTLQWGNKN